MTKFRKRKSENGAKLQKNEKKSRSLPPHNSNGIHKFKTRSLEVCSIINENGNLNEN
jgi:hypothetical protein